MFAQHDKPQKHAHELWRHSGPYLQRFFDLCSSAQNQDWAHGACFTPRLKLTVDQFSERQKPDSSLLLTLRQF